MTKSEARMTNARLVSLSLSGGGEAAPSSFGFRASFVIRASSFVIFFFLTLRSGFGATYDLEIRHGRVVDGTGNPAFFADVGITNGRIAAIGSLTNDATKTIDASGLVLAPGFIDVHTHAEEIADLPLAENFV